MVVEALQIKEQDERNKAQKEADKRAWLKGHKELATTPGLVM